MEEVTTSIPLSIRTNQSLSRILLTIRSSCIGVGQKTGGNSGCARQARPNPPKIRLTHPQRARLLRLSVPLQPTCIEQQPCHRIRHIFASAHCLHRPHLAHTLSRIGSLQSRLLLLARQDSYELQLPIPIPISTNIYLGYQKFPDNRWISSCLPPPLFLLAVPLSPLHSPPSPTQPWRPREHLLGLCRACGPLHRKRPLRHIFAGSRATPPAPQQYPEHSQPRRPPAHSPDSSDPPLRYQCDPSPRPRPHGMATSSRQSRARSFGSPSSTRTARNTS